MEKERILNKCWKYDNPFLIHNINNSKLIKNYPGKNAFSDKPLSGMFMGQWIPFNLIYFVKKSRFQTITYIMFACQNTLNWIQLLKFMLSNRYADQTDKKKSTHTYIDHSLFVDFLIHQFSRSLPHTLPFLSFALNLAVTYVNRIKNKIIH